MKISYQWLQSYFDEKLPTPEALAERLMFGFAEVESVEWKNGNAILDVKVLPDRACYALSHRGVAREVAAILGLEMKETDLPVVRASRGVSTVSVRVAEKGLSPRYTARRIEGVEVAPSPRWLTERIESIGERSINNIVDATNFVMFDIGQPLHAFDADNIRGGIVVRKAKAGERLTTLDGKELTLNESTLVIADDAGPLALAGVKGGKRAEVTDKTEAIIVEAASFDAAHTRRASQTCGVRTESSRRFENNLSPHGVREGSDACAALIARLSPGARFGKVTDLFFRRAKPKSIAVAPSFIARSLGIELGEKEVRAALARLGLSTKRRGKALVVAPPPERRDLVRAEDLVEEVGRIVGLERIPETELPPAVLQDPRDLKPSNLGGQSRADVLRTLLISEGFSEVLTSSFASIGDLAIEKPLASDKAFCRKDLWTNFHPALLKNYSNAPLLGADEVRMFEIGKVFTKKGEHSVLIIGVMPAKKSVRDIVEKIEKILGAPLCGKFCGGNNVYECTF